MTLKNLAQRLFILKPVLNLIFMIGIVVIAFLFIKGSIEQQNSYALPSLLLATWSLLLSALIGLLVNTPSHEHTSKGWLSGIKHRLAKGMFRLVASAFVIISLALLYATIKLLNL